MLFGHGIAGGAAGFADDFVGIEINLPVVIGVTIRAHGEHRTIEVELKYFDIGRRISFDIRYLADPFFEQFDRFIVIDRVGKLGFQVDATI